MFPKFFANVLGSLPAPPQSTRSLHAPLHIFRNLTSSENKPGDDLNEHYECSQRKWLLGQKVQALGNRSPRQAILERPLAG